MLSPPHERITRLLPDLDAGDFAVRERASAELAKLGEGVKPSLRHALRKQPSPEAAHRLTQLLEQTNSGDGADIGGELVRGVRVVEVLENIGTPEARVVLKGLAEGTPSTWLTDEAGLALKRVARE